MTPIEQAKAHYVKHGLNFEQDLGYYLVNAYVVAAPDRFMMFKPVRAEIGEADWFPAQPDAWYVHYAAGKRCLEWFLGQAPFFLPKIAWMRDKGLKAQRLAVYDTVRLYDRLKHK